MADLIYANTLDEAIEAKNKGFEPVECAFGKESVVGKFILDHHGKYSNEPAVSIKAAKLAQQGVRLDNFVVTGQADCDQMYAIAALNGRIPINMEEAEWIAIMDTNPIGKDRTWLKYLPILIFEHQTQGLENNLEGSKEALNKLINVYTRNISGKEINAALQYEETRKMTVLSDLKMITAGKVGLAVSEKKGFDVWYEKAPVIIQYNPISQSITFGLCPIRGVTLTALDGFDIIGPDGFNFHYSEFDKILGSPGCGGRDVVGGSPRNEKFSEADAVKLYAYLTNFANTGMK